MNDKIKAENGKVYYHWVLLKNWEKNDEARMITTDNWNKLIADIKRNGVRDEFKIGEDFIVYDGNHRLKAVKYWLEKGIQVAENGRDLAWIPAIVVNPTTEAEKWEIALTRNEAFASWNKETLGNYLPEFEDAIDLSLINIDFYDPKNYEQQVVVTDDDATTVAPQKKEKKTKDVVCPNCSHPFAIEL